MPETHIEDMQLRATLDRVFAEDLAGCAAPSPALAANPHLLRHDAYMKMRIGDRAGALASLNQAIALDPYHPIQYQMRNELLGDKTSTTSSVDPMKA